MTPPTPNIPDQPIEITTVYTVFMFCYPWIPRGPNEPFDEAVRLPRPSHRDQSTDAYGQSTFAEAMNAGCDVMVGFQIMDAAGNFGSSYRNFIASIDPWHQGQTDVAKIALSFEVRNPADAKARPHIDEMRAQASRARYYSFVDSAGRTRVPFFFWGIDAVNDPSRLDELGALLDRLRADIVRPDGTRAKPFLVWEGQILREWEGRASWSAAHKAQIRSFVLDKLHGVYQHGLSIPPIQYTVPEPVDWTRFPRYSLMDRHPNGSGRTIISDTAFEIRRLSQIISSHSLRGDDGAPLKVIPGAMPQYSRERFTYAELARRNVNPKVIDQARIICTDPAHVGALFREVRDRGSLFRRRTVAPGKIREDRFVALTSWAEWAEGSTFEPCGGGVPGYDPAISGICDTSGQFLAQIRQHLRTSVRVVGSASTDSMEGES